MRTTVPAIRRRERLVRRVLCAIGLHQPIGWFVLTGLTAPLYEQRVECLWCLRRFR